MRSAPDFRPTVWSRIVPHLSGLAAQMPRRPPDHRTIARWTAQAATMNQRGGRNGRRFAGSVIRGCAFGSFDQLVVDEARRAETYGEGQEGRSVQGVELTECRC